MAEKFTEEAIKTVENHYNNLKETGLTVRSQSRIFYLRNFNNWIKSVLISKYISKIKQNKKSKIINVLDMCSGKGGDQLKWKKGGVQHVIFADIAGESVKQSEQRYNEMKSRISRESKHNDAIFTAEFITIDCCKELLTNYYKNQIIFDLCSCQFSFHYSFESLDKAKMMIRNACERIRPGGYFIGTTPDSNEIVKRIRESSDGKSFGNSVYEIEFEHCYKNVETEIPLFGAKYNFHLQDVVDCPEFLVYFKVFEKLVEEFNMKLILKQNFAEFFKENIANHDYRGLIGKMQGLEPYPPAEGIDLLGNSENDYLEVKLKYEMEKNDVTKHRNTYGTLSKEEWEAASLYLVFAFKKDDDAPKPTL